MSAISALLADTSRVSLFRATKASLSLLSSADRSKYALVVVAQMLTALLDLAGVVVVGLVGLLAASSAQGVALPAALQSLLDTAGLTNVSLQALTGYLAVTAVILLLLKTTLYGMLTRWIYRFLGRRQADVAARLVSDFLSLPLTSVERRSSQDTAYGLSFGVAAAISSLLGGVAVILSEVSVLAVLGVALFFVNPWITLSAILFFSAVGVALQRGFASWSARIGQTQAETSVVSHQSIQEALTAYREVFVAGRRKFYVERVSILLRRGASAQADAAFVAQVPKLTYEAALVVGALVLTGWQLLTQNFVIAIATLSIFLVAAARVIPSMIRLGGMLISMRSIVWVARRAYEVAAECESLEGSSKSRLSSAGSIEATRDRSDFLPFIEVDHVTYKYAGATRAALTDISFFLSPGCSAAIVGATGCGKSTLADVICGLLEPDSGRVLLGGVAPIEAINQWPNRIAYVPQSVAIVNGTVRENVALGLPSGSRSDDDIWKSLEQVKLDLLLREQRDGLDTIVGERGVRLSGGQRQRLGLARALLSGPRLLLLDEATSALDAATERTITEAIRQLEGRVTTLIIAHRLAAIRDVDLVLFLEDGRLTAAGAFDEVRSISETFDRQARLLGIDVGT